jgi:hypothetical protein
LQFVTFSVLSCPPNYLWQSFLEAQFPAYAPELDKTEKAALADDSVTGRSTGVEKANQRRVEKKALIEKSEKPASKGAPKKLSIKNTAIKFSLDQTIGAAANVSTLSTVDLSRPCIDISPDCAVHCRNRAAQRRVAGDSYEQCSRTVLDNDDGRIEALACREYS